MVESISKNYQNTKFSPTLLKQVRKHLEKYVDSNSELKLQYASVKNDNTNYSYRDTPDDEAEFYVKYDECIDYADVLWVTNDINVSVSINYQRFFDSSQSNIKVRLPNLSAIHDTFSIFDDAQNDAHEHFDKIEKERVPPTVFLGHGRSAAWRDLRDHLRDHHGYKVEAYETGARAGHTIRDIVEQMAKKSDMAFLVHSAEDELQNGRFQARPNVIHETGLFQGKLGFSRAIVLLEEGCEEFSNLAGIQQIRFSKNNIRETFGDVLGSGFITNR
ncbi:hypothetical protein FLO80_20915 [Aquicoccus porphyridii]|uniref:CD-NTase-associated protein 12/Pycsar effector protein TIR domain-containing protein n=1 Tax=Aquicoccus porphyridii TaxID=1852029 RepID=A0A5A9YXM6_9RHOB|nr:nucleotide-binding protein [Aquicoccus porphyridii]KAA0909597.1 hypothetical protein FLO80_20915 [Aquicoccus porphyridii]RAI51848.1 hypothetical protein DOO74_20965 [Rhodobacteraceae bacterium AsT-22]